MERESFPCILGQDRGLILGTQGRSPACTRISELPGEMGKEFLTHGAMNDTPQRRENNTPPDLWEQDRKCLIFSVFSMFVALEGSSFWLACSYPLWIKKKFWVDSFSFVEVLYSSSLCHRMLKQGSSCFNSNLHLGLLICSIPNTKVGMWLALHMQNLQRKFQKTRVLSQIKINRATQQLHY